MERRYFRVEIPVRFWVGKEHFGKCFLPTKDNSDE